MFGSGLNNCQAHYTLELKLRNFVNNLSWLVSTALPTAYLHERFPKSKAFLERFLPPEVQRGELGRAESVHVFVSGNRFIRLPPWSKPLSLCRMTLVEMTRDGELSRSDVKVQLRPHTYFVFRVVGDDPKLSKHKKKKTTTRHWRPRRHIPGCNQQIRCIYENLSP